MPGFRLKKKAFDAVQNVVHYDSQAFPFKENQKNKGEKLLDRFSIQIRWQQILKNAERP